MATLLRMTLRATCTPVLVTFGLLALVGLVVQSAVLLLRASAVPSFVGVLELSLAIVPAFLPLLISVGVFVGVWVAMGGWRARGEWTGLQALGCTGRQVARAMLLVSVLSALLVALSTQIWAPWGHRAAARVLADAAAELRLVPGQFLPMGDVVLHLGPSGEWVVAGPDWIGAAQSGGISVVNGRPIVTLERGAASGPNRTQVAFERADFGLVGAEQGRRIELAERSASGLRSLISSTEEAGRDASYERTVLYKRAALPVAAFLLPLLALCMGLRWGVRPVWGCAVVLGYWVLVRLGDQWCGSIGPLLAATIAPMGLLVSTLWAWAGWRDR